MTESEEKPPWQDRIRLRRSCPKCNRKGMWLYVQWARIRCKHRGCKRWFRFRGI